MIATFVLDTGERKMWLLHDIVNFVPSYMRAVRSSGSFDQIRCDTSQVIRRSLLGISYFQPYTAQNE